MTEKTACVAWFSSGDVRLQGPAPRAIVSSGDAWRTKTDLRTPNAPRVHAQEKPLVVVRRGGGGESDGVGRHAPRQAERQAGCVNAAQAGRGTPKLALGLSARARAGGEGPAWLCEKLGPAPKFCAPGSVRARAPDGRRVRRGPPTGSGDS